MRSGRRAGACVRRSPPDHPVRSPSESTHRQPRTTWMVNGAAGRLERPPEARDCGVQRVGADAVVDPVERLLGALRVTTRPFARRSCSRTPSPGGGRGRGDGRQPPPDGSSCRGRQAPPRAGCRAAPPGRGRSTALQRARSSGISDRLHHVVVGAGVEARDALVEAVPRCEHDHGKARSRRHSARKVEPRHRPAAERSRTARSWTATATRSRAAAAVAAWSTANPPRESAAAMASASGAWSSTRRRPHRRAVLPEGSAGPPVAGSAEGRRALRRPRAPRGSRASCRWPRGCGPSARRRRRARIPRRGCRSRARRSARRRGPGGARPPEPSPSSRSR